MITITGKNRNALNQWLQAKGGKDCWSKTAQQLSVEFTAETGIPSTSENLSYARRYLFADEKPRRHSAQLALASSTPAIMDALMKIEAIERRLFRIEVSLGLSILTKTWPANVAPEGEK